MLGNPLVRFREGQGGNQMMVPVTPSLRAPCLLDRALKATCCADTDSETRSGFVRTSMANVNEVVGPVPLRQETRTRTSASAMHSAPSRFIRYLDPFIFYALLTIIVLTAVPYGTVEPWWKAVFQCAVFALGCLWIVEGT